MTSGTACGFSGCHFQPPAHQFPEVSGAEGLASSAEYSHFLGPLLLDWIVYLMGVLLVLGLVLRMLRPPPQVLKVVSVILWGWALWIALSVAVDMGLGGVTWTTRFSVLETRDAVLSWDRRLDGYGP